MTSLDHIPEKVRKQFLAALASTTAVRRREAAYLLRQYPSLAILKDTTGLLDYYPTIGAPLADPKLKREQRARQFVDWTLERQGWISFHVYRELSFLGIASVKRYRVDYALRIFNSRLQQYVTTAFIEVKSQEHVTADGLRQARNYAEQHPQSRSIRFVFATNGQSFMRYDRLTERIQKACPLEEFPTPSSLKKSLCS